MDQYLTKTESVNRTTFCDEMLLVLRAPLKVAIYLLLFRLLLPSISYIFTVQIYDKLQMVLGTAVKISVHKKVAWALNEWLHLQKMKAKKLFNRFKPVTTCDDAWRRQRYDDSVTSTALRRQCDVDSVTLTCDAVRTWSPSERLNPKTFRWASHSTGISSFFLLDAGGFESRRDCNDETSHT